MAQANLGLFVAHKSGLPLFYCNYNGGLNDFTNFPYVLKKAHELGLNDKFTIVCDGIFSNEETVDFTKLKKNKVIVGAPIDHCKSVKENVLSWRKGCTSADDIIDPLADRDYSSREVPFKIGTTDGRLFMYHNRVKANLESSTLQNEVLAVKYEVDKHQNYLEKEGRQKIQ